MTRIVSPMAEGRTDFAKSRRTREESREFGRLYEPALDEVECDCGGWFVPTLSGQIACRRCRWKERRGAAQAEGA